MKNVEQHEFDKHHFWPMSKFGPYVWIPRWPLCCPPPVRHNASKASTCSRRGIHARMRPLLLCYSPRRPPHARLSKWRSTPAPSSSISTPCSLSPSPYGHSGAGPPWPAAMPQGWAWPSHHESPQAELSGLMDAGKSPGAPPPLPHRRRGHLWPESAKPAILLRSLFEQRKKKGLVLE
jgi:hypothetical protein